MPRPPGPTPPPSSKTLAPPPRRRTSTPGNGAGAAQSAPPRPAPPRPPAARPTPPRTQGGRRPNHARRRSIALALLLTVVILAGYGLYVAYDKLTGDSAPTAESGTGYVASVQTAMAHGEWSVGMGLNFHNLKDSYVLREQFNAEINTVRTQRANLETLLPNVLGPRADTVRASIQTMSALETALGQWRDAIFLLRLGSVNGAQSAIESSVAQLQQQLDTWNNQEAAT